MPILSYIKGLSFITLNYNYYTFKKRIHIVISINIPTYVSNTFLYSSLYTQFWQNIFKIIRMLNKGAFADVCAQSF